MRKSKRILKRVLSVVTAALMAIGMFNIGGTQRSMEAVKAANYDSASSVNFDRVLGRATDYGVLCKTLNKNDHMETTYATQLFNGTGNVDIDMAGELPVQFMIGEIGSGSKLEYGKAAVTGMKYNVYTTEDVKSHIQVHTTNPVPDVVITTASKTDINENVASMIQHVKDQSSTLASKPDTEGFTIDTTGKVVLDVKKDALKNNVVYVKVAADSPIANAIKQSEGLVIKKYSSTVVVFNMPASNDSDDTLSINKYKVIYTDDTSNVEKELNTDHSQYVMGAVAQELYDMDEQICQKIIWNMPSSTKVSLTTTLGCFLVPTEGANVTAGSSGGWVAVDGTFKNTGEWHYIYQGRSNTNNDSIHFATYKAFTGSYVTRDSSDEVIPLSNIEFSAGDYKFDFYKSNENFTTDSSGLVETISNDAAGTVTFSNIYYTDSGDYYYVIKEQNAGVKKNGITNSDGEIDIKVHVDKTVDSATNEVTYKYTVSTWKYLSAADKAAGKVYKKVDSRVMTGVELTLGGMYNLADVGNLEITVKDEDTGEPVPGAKVDVTNPDGTKTTYTTDANGKITISNTPSGNHSIVVTEVPANYRVTTGKNATVKVESGATKKHEAEVTTTGGLKVTVLEETTGDPVKDAVVKVTDAAGNSTEYTTDANGVITVNPTDTGKYDVVVTKVPAGKKVTVGETKTLTVTKGAIAEHVAKINNAGTGNLEVTVTDEATNKPVPDASVDITDPSGTKDTHTTDTNGKVTLSNVPTGEYTVEVTKVPDGYTVTTGQKTTVTVKENDTAKDEIKVSDSAVSKTPNQTTAVTATNNSDKAVQTGDNFNAKTPITLWIISLMGIVALIYGKKKYDIF